MRREGWGGWTLRQLRRLLLLICLVGLVVGGWIRTEVLADLPSDLTEMRDYRPLTAVQLLAGEEVVDRFYLERRIWVDFDSLPPWVPAAFVAAEDRRFFEHPGVDFIGIARAFIVNLKAGGRAQGGSTITQQLVKNLLTGAERSYRRKMREAVLAWRLEQNLDKEQILELYLNFVALGAGNNGVEVAARDYFGRPAAELSPGQAALLAGLVPAPSRYNPRVDPERARARRGLVLRGMVEQRFLSPAQALKGLDEPIAPPPRSGDARAPHAAYLTAVRGAVRSGFGDRWPFEQGLRVSTALDPATQHNAEQAIEAALDAHQQRQGFRARGSAVVIENRSGRVLALTSGVDATLGGFVRATQARRQPGSSFKPYVYGAALARGWRPSDTILDGPLTLGNWSPRNYSGSYAGPVSLQTALARSYNTPAVRLALAVGMDPVVDLVAAMGVRTALRRDPTVALGSSELTVLDQALGFATIARYGVPTEPVLIDRLEDATGAPVGRSGERVGETRLPGGPQPRALPADVSWELVEMLRAVVEQGTARRAFHPERDRAGKTGTTNEARDAWFVGFTPRHTVAVWIGTDGQDSLGEGESGGRTALPAWVGIVEPLEEAAGPAGWRFRPPTEVVLAQRDGRWVGERPDARYLPPAGVPLPSFDGPPEAGSGAR